jgi:uncharacterized protein DUF2806
MNDTNFSLIDLKALSKPAVKLIEAVSSAVGVLYEPTRIKRRAKAEADALVILAKNQADINEIEHRASERLVGKEIRRQKNVENITKMALDELPDKVSDEKPDEDWIFNFFETCQDISNEQMQLLWGRLLAGEVSKPGTFSLRTIRIVKDFSKDEADLFTRFCTFVWMSPGVGLLPLIFNVKDEYLVNKSINYDKLQQLDAMGLINFNPMTGYNLDNFARANFSYYGESYSVFRPQNKKAHLGIGIALLTAEGEQLVLISGSNPSEEYKNFVLKRWEKQGLIINRLSK